MGATSENHVSVASPTALAAAAILLQAHDYARDAGVDPWQFAIDRHELQPATALDLRWLLARRFAEHALETTTDRDATRTFRAMPSAAFPPRTCLILTDAGADAFRPLLQVLTRVTCAHQSCDRYPISPQSQPLASLPSPHGLDPHQPRADAGSSATPSHTAPATPFAPNNIELATVPAPHASAAPSHESIQRGKSAPHWDAQLRELRLGNKLVKRFRVPAANQELILNVFQEEGWPECIDDPLPPKGDDPVRRLQATIKSLNRHQAEPLIRFHGNGEGHAVCWELA